MLTTIKDKFWGWYEHSYKANLNFAAVVFSLQLVHLLWLTTDVVLHRIFGFDPFLEGNRTFQFILGLVDYLEIPTIIAVSLVYIHSFVTEKKKSALWYLILLNTQWIHILWITDEYVVDLLEIHEVNLAAHIMVWAAILIDYLEIPVIIDTLKKVRTEGKKAFVESD
jgi:hypothetical protein